MRNVTNKLLLVIAVAAAAAIVVIGTLYAAKAGPFSPTENTESANSQEVVTPSEVNATTDEAETMEPIAQNNEGSLSTKITKLEVSEKSLLIRSETTGVIVGTCILKLIHQGQPVVQTTSTRSLSNSATTCDGFDVPLTQLTDRNYEVILIIEANDQKSITKAQLAL